MGIRVVQADLDRVTSVAAVHRSRSWLPNVIEKAKVLRGLIDTFAIARPTRSLSAVTARRQATVSPEILAAGAGAPS